MNHAITIGDVMLWVGIPVGLIILGICILAVLSLLNPFRSGH
jgi:hypothetical protein